MLILHLTSWPENRMKQSAVPVLGMVQIRPAAALCFGMGTELALADGQYKPMASLVCLSQVLPDLGGII